MYAATQENYDAFLAVLDESLKPRSPDVMYDKFNDLGPTQNMFQNYFEKAFTLAGFSVIEADVFSSQWREYGEETESKVTSKQLLRIVRLRRHRERYIAEFGEKDYACELANCHWGVYQMLGKLSPVIYTLE